MCKNGMCVLENGMCMYIHNPCQCKCVRVTYLLQNKNDINIKIHDYCFKSKTDPNKPRLNARSAALHILRYLFLRKIDLTE